MGVKWTLQKAQVALSNMVAGMNTVGQAYLRFYDGQMPATADAPADGNILATLNVSASAGGGTVFNGASGDPPTAVGTTTGGWFARTTNAAMSGTATYWRLFTGSNIVVCQGTIGTAGADINLNTTSIVAGATITITAMSLRILGLN